MQDVSIRFATADDARALEWVAQRDTHRVPAGPHLVAEVGGRILVVHSLTSGEAVADPFTRTAELREMVALQAAQLTARVAGRQVSLAGGWVGGYPQLEAR